MIGDITMQRESSQSAYMGHDSLDYTAYYIHLVPDHLMASGLTGWECGLEVPEYED